MVTTKAKIFLTINFTKMNILKLNSTRIFLIIILIGLISFSGCSLFRKRYEKTEKKDFVVNTTGKKKVVFDNTNGNIKVTKNSADSVLIFKAEATFRVTKKEMKEEKEKIKVNIDTLGDVIKITSDYIKEKRFFNFQINFDEHTNYELIVPEGIEVSIDNTNGKMEIADINNNVGVNSTNGNVVLTHTTGNISIDATNGKVKGELDSAKSLNIIAINGIVNLNLSDTFSGKFRLETINGKISKGDFDFKDVENDKKLFKGTLGDSDAEIKIKTTNGKITLTKKVTTKDI
jgi:DUF4097 and DUF4098 domain-containing protein YvlB